VYIVYVRDELLQKSNSVSDCFSLEIKEVKYNVHEILAYLMIYQDIEIIINFLNLFEENTYESLKSSTLIY